MYDFLGKYEKKTSGTCVLPISSWDSTNCRAAYDYTEYLPRASDSVISTTLSTRPYGCSSDQTTSGDPWLYGSSNRDGADCSWSYPCYCFKPKYQSVVAGFSLQWMGGDDIDQCARDNSRACNLGANRCGATTECYPSDLLGSTRVLQWMVCDYDLPSSREHKTQLGTVAASTVTCDPGTRILFGFKAHFSTEVLNGEEACVEANNGPCTVGDRSCTTIDCDTTGEDMMFIYIVCQTDLPYNQVMSVESHVKGTTEIACPTGAVLKYGFAFQWLDFTAPPIQCFADSYKTCDLGATTCNIPACEVTKAGVSVSSYRSVLGVCTAPTCTAETSSDGKLGTLPVADGAQISTDFPVLLSGEYRHDTRVTYLCPPGSELSHNVGIICNAGTWQLDGQTPEPAKMGTTRHGPVWPFDDFDSQSCDSCYVFKNYFVVYAVKLPRDGFISWVKLRFSKEASATWSTPPLRLYLQVWADVSTESDTHYKYELQTTQEFPVDASIRGIDQKIYIDPPLAVAKDQMWGLFSESDYLYLESTEDYSFNSGDGHKFYTNEEYSFNVVGGGEEGCNFVGCVQEVRTYSSFSRQGRSVQVGLTHEHPSCDDINECESAVCDTNSDCINESPFFSCQCFEGYSGTGLVSGDGCSDINECLDSETQCSPPSSCFNFNGGYSCAPYFSGGFIDPLNGNATGLSTQGGDTLTMQIYFTPIGNGIKYDSLTIDYGFDGQVAEPYKCATTTGLVEPEVAALVTVVCTLGPGIGDNLRFRLHYCKGSLCGTADHSEKFSYVHPSLMYDTLTPRSAIQGREVMVSFQGDNFVYDPSRPSQLRVTFGETRFPDRFPCNLLSATRYNRIVCQTEVNKGEGTNLQFSIIVHDGLESAPLAGYVITLPDTFSFVAQNAETPVVLKVESEACVNQPDGDVTGCPTDGGSLITLIGEHFRQPMSVEIGGGNCLPPPPELETSRRRFSPFRMGLLLSCVSFHGGLA